ncbi:hypothetical protein APB26_31445 [Pseudomonas aeruginosa]|nr:hypothetical protein APB26_31445 [Pseudomonas aeruginosa]
MGFTSFTMKEHDQTIVLGKIGSAGEVLHRQLRLDPLEIQALGRGQHLKIVDNETATTKHPGANTGALCQLFHARAAEDLVKVHGGLQEMGGTIPRGEYAPFGLCSMAALMLHRVAADYQLNRTMAIK